jgi:hypothetical protein
VRFRPTLEPLDPRVVPAVNHWRPVGGSTDFDVGANWSLGHVPVADEDVWFVPTLGPGGAVSVDCEGMRWPIGGEYNSVFLDNAYDATVTLSQDLDTRALVVLGGTIDQPYYSSDTTDIRVTGNPAIDNDNQNILYGRPDFHWTGGTLNSTSHAAHLILDGATGAIEPDSGGTVHLGSNLSLVAGAIVTMYEGTTEVTNDSVEFDIGEECGMIVDPGDEREYVIAANVPTPPRVSLNGEFGEYLEVRSGTWRHQGRVENQGGRFTLRPRTWAYIFSPDQQPAFAYYQSSGVTQLYAYSTLEVVGFTAKAVHIDGGKLSTLREGNSGPADATIKGRLWVYGGEITINDGVFAGHDYSELKVQGQVAWFGGTFRPVVNGLMDGAFQADWWYATGKFEVGGSAVLAPAAIDAQGNLIAPDHAGMFWRILESDVEITVPPDNNDPAITGPWVWDKRGNPVKEWWIEST